MSLLNHPDFPHGILLLHKIAHASSHDAVRKIRKILNTRAVGHTGTLDPMATGMLPLVIGEATRFASLLSSQKKRYRASVQLGSQTDTDDALGQIVHTHSVPPYTLRDCESFLMHFLGDSIQQVPQYSALRKDGQRMYHLARQGVPFTAPARHVTTQDITLLSYDADRHILSFEITVSSGTYIRAIARDLGQLMGCCAHLCALERLWVSPYEKYSTIDYDDIAEASILSQSWIPLRDILSEYHTITLSTPQALALGHGNIIPIEHIFPENSLVRVQYQAELYGICRYHHQHLTVHRLRSFPVPWVQSLCV